MRITFLSSHQHLTPVNPEYRASLNSLVHVVVGAAYEVSNTLGAGFLEKVYERALLSELNLRGIPVKTQVIYPVSYKDQYVRDYIADLIVDSRLLVEIKCVEQFAERHRAQCINYLRASNLHLALLINFQHPRIKWQRIVLGF
jgi:GxxExxY protein